MKDRKQTATLSAEHSKAKGHSKAKDGSLRPAPVMI
jgi:hypothetical protein